MRYTLSPEWDIEVPNHFQHRLEDDHVVFWTRGVTLLCTIFSYSGEKGRDILLANLRARAEVRELQTIQDIQGDIVRFAYLQPEEIRPRHFRLAMHAFTAAPYRCLQTSFYIDDPSTLQDQLKIWNSSRYHPEGASSDNSI